MMEKINYDIKKSSEINSSEDNTVLEIDAETKKLIKKMSTIFIIILTIFYIFSFLLMDGFLSFVIISGIYLFFTELSLFIYNKSLIKFIISGDKIYKSSILRKNKYMCRLEDITGYYNVGISEIAILNNNKIIFILSTYCNNPQFFQFLEMKDKAQVFCKGIDSLAYLSFFLGIICLPFIFMPKSFSEDVFIIVFLILTILWGINEKRKYILLTNKLVTIRKIFSKKTYKYTDFNKIIYKKNSDDAGVILWEIKAYRNKKRIFSFNHIYDDSFQKMLQYFSYNKIETVQKKRWL